MVHLLFTCGPSASFFCLPNPFSTEVVNIRNTFNCDTDLQDRKPLKTKHNVAMLVTVDYLDPRVDKEMNNRAITRGTHQ